MKKCKECGREETGYGSLLDEDGYCFTCGIKHNKEKIKRLHEQLTEANKLIKDFHEMHEFNKSVIEYLEKWGVK